MKIRIKCVMINRNMDTNETGVRKVMFEKKQIIYSESQGVCRVDNIVSLSAVKGEPGVPYYVLKSVFDDSKVSYIPVENHQVVLRELFTKEEALALKDSKEAKEIEVLWQAITYVLEQQSEK